MQNLISYKNTEIAFSCKGQGNPLVLLHGFLESAAIWEPFLAPLSQQRQVICIDLLGHGKTGNLAEIHSMELMADAVLHVLDFLNIEKASFAGHSMGGYVGLEILKKFPQKITNLSLINSTPEEDSEEKKENRDRVAHLVAKNKKAFVSMAISNLLTTENNKKFQKEIEILKERALKISAENIIAATLGMKNRNSSVKALKDFTGDKFIILGRQDPVLNPTEVAKIAKSTNANLIVFAGGHLSFIENKEELLNFFQSET